VFNVLLYAAAGLAVLAAIVMLFARSRRSDTTDHVDQNVLARIKHEYRDIG
jgi:hypothetical protein